MNTQETDRNLVDGLQVLLNKGTDNMSAPTEGDICVTKAFRGDNNHPHGHISMYNGSQWVSDFKQKDIWAGGDYRKHKPQNIIFRWTKK